MRRSEPGDRLEIARSGDAQRGLGFLPAFGEKTMVEINLGILLCKWTLNLCTPPLSILEARYVPRKISRAPEFLKFGITANI